jgi:oligopeptidase A
MTQPDNPLCPAQLDDLDIPFDRIHAAHVEPAIDALIAEAQAQLDAIAEGAQRGAPPTYEGTLGALERATERLEYAIGITGHLESVATEDALRAAYNAAQPKVAAFSSAIPMNEGLYRALCAFSETQEARDLPPARARFLQKTLADFRRHGALLPPAGKERLARINVELAQLTTRYGQNVLDATTAFELYLTDEAQLAGLPETARLVAREGAAARGRAGWRFSLHEPSLIAVLTYLDDAAVREQMWRAHSRRATSGEGDNRPLIAQILALRAEKARLLGFAHFADLVLEDRMAGTGERALFFVEDLRARTQPAFLREAEELHAFRKELEGPDAPPLKPWDLAYYAEKQRRARYDLDEEALRPYFPAEQVLAGLFRLAERLYGVRLQERPMPAWDPAVRGFEIREGDQVRATFYVDLYPRENKRGGAWMNALITGTPGCVGGAAERHVGLFCANVQPPAGGRPALLSHREVETLFHEFGHLLHHALSQVPVRSLAGTSVPWDFVELPSQIMENFCWERESLDLFARHHETGAPIPEDLLSRMRRARTYRAATAMMRQLGFARVDLLLHTRYDQGRDGDVMAFGRAVLQEHSPAPLPPDHGMLAGFGHLFASPVGYAAGYYSYKWAEVLDADAFARFREEGILNPAVGQAFRAHVLSQGDSQDPMALFTAFRGRPPRLDALLERAGLLPSSPQGAP